MDSRSTYPSSPYPMIYQREIRFISEISRLLNNRRAIAYHPFLKLRRRYRGRRSRVFHGWRKEKRKGAAGRGMIIRGNEFELNSVEFEVCLKAEARVSEEPLSPRYWRKTNLPLQTSRIIRRSTSCSSVWCGEDVKDMLIAVLRYAQWKLVGRVADQRELVEEALYRSRDCENSVGCRGLRVSSWRLIALDGLGGHCPLSDARRRVGRKVPCRRHNFFAYSCCLG